MTRRIHSVIVERISLLTGTNQPAVPHAASMFRIQKSALSGGMLSLESRMKLQELEKKLKRQTKTP